ncbi:MAG: hypothetical protein AB7G37_15350 [Solirubrobacteraceae bacterium]
MHMFPALDTLSSLDRRIDTRDSLAVELHQMQRTATRSSERITSRPVRRSPLAAILGR